MSAPFSDPNIFGYMEKDRFIGKCSFISVILSDSRGNALVTSLHRAEAGKSSDASIVFEEILGAAKNAKARAAPFSISPFVMVSEIRYLYFQDRTTPCLPAVVGG